MGKDEWKREQAMKRKKAVYVNDNKININTNPFILSQMLYTKKIVS
jgi:hypothetical protein